MTHDNSFITYLPEKVWSVCAPIVNCLVEHGARVYAVGGIVRDYVMNQAHLSADIDFEVHEMPFERLQELLALFGSVHYDGKSFGVLRITGIQADWSIPRRDSSGRKPAVGLDASMGIKAALLRRDLTMNALAIDLTSGELIDPFGGVNDIKNRLLRTPDIHFFQQDPLRFFRVMQFISRFGMTPDETLQQVCLSMNISCIAQERIHQEFHKLATSAHPSGGIRWLNSIGRLPEVLPEVAHLVGVPQERDWHPEGDVFEHTMQAIDAATLRPVENVELLVYAALCHDLGKVSTTRLIAGRLRSLGHDAAGVPVARSCMKRITGNKKLIDHVALLVYFHMRPGQLVKQRAGAAAYKRLAAQLAPYTSLYELAQLAYADKLGRNPSKYKPLQEDLPDIDIFIKNAEKYGVLYVPEKSLITGQDIMALGVSGPEVGRLLRKAYTYQIENPTSTREKILAYLQK